MFLKRTSKYLSYCSWVMQQEFLVYVALQQEQGAVQAGEGLARESGLEAGGHSGEPSLLIRCHGRQLRQFLLQEEELPEVRRGQATEGFLPFPDLEVRQGLPRFQGFEQVPVHQGVQQVVEKVP